MPRRGFEKISSAEILDALRQFSSGRDENFTMKEFCTHIGISPSTLLERRGDLRKAAGLKRPAPPQSKLSRIRS